MTRPLSAIPTLEESDGARSIVAAGLRLTFRREGDRWSHALIADSCALASSFEAEGGEISRVPSPTYQELHFQAGRGSMLAFLVGQNGPHHFSAVFRFEPRGDSGVSIEVDFADRCRTPIEGLAATYLISASSGDLVDADGSAVAWDRGPSIVRIEAIDGSWLAIAEAGRRGTQLQIAAPIEPGASTHRCRYRWVRTLKTSP